MSEACGDGICLAYFKHCDTSASFISCDYFYSQPGDYQNSEVTISYSSVAGQAAAESSISVLVGRGWKTAQIPLRSFEIVSQRSKPPICDRKQPQAVCWLSEQTPQR